MLLFSALRSILSCLLPETWRVDALFPKVERAFKGGFGDQHSMLWF